MLAPSDVTFIIEFSALAAVPHISNSDSSATLEEGVAEKEVLISGSVIDQAVNHEAISKALRQVKDAFELALEKRCHPRETIVAVRKTLVRRLEVSGMTLNDPTCTASLNATHWFLKSPR